MPKSHNKAKEKAEGAQQQGWGHQLAAVIRAVGDASKKGGVVFLVALFLLNISLTLYKTPPEKYPDLGPLLLRTSLGWWIAGVLAIAGMLLVAIVLLQRMTYRKRIDELAARNKALERQLPGFVARPTSAPTPIAPTSP